MHVESLAVGQSHRLRGPLPQTAGVELNMAFGQMCFKAKPFPGRYPG